MLVGKFYRNEKLDFMSNGKKIEKGETIQIHGAYGSLTDIEVIDNMGLSRIITVLDRNLEEAEKLGILVEIEKEEIKYKDSNKPKFKIGDMVANDISCGIVHGFEYSVTQGWQYDIWYINEYGDSDISRNNYEDSLELIESNSIISEFSIMGKKFKVEVSRVEE